jgi:hypothetical protein
MFDPSCYKNVLDWVRYPDTAGTAGNEEKSPWDLVTEEESPQTSLKKLYSNIFYFLKIVKIVPI